MPFARAYAERGLGPQAVCQRGISLRPWAPAKLWDAPALGADNAAILAGLGISQAAADDLRTRGIIR
jgi:crotonobetainyl-CoA:carnitine CoA-transferase CaiB-like acyl-CoA transferase